MDSIVAVCDGFVVEGVGAEAYRNTVAETVVGFGTEGSVRVGDEGALGDAIFARNVGGGGGRGDGADG